MCGFFLVHSSPNNLTMHPNLNIIPLQTTKNKEAVQQESNMMTLCIFHYPTRTFYSDSAATKDDEITSNQVIKLYNPAKNIYMCGAGIFSEVLHARTIMKHFNWTDDFHKDLIKLFSDTPVTNSEFITYNSKEDILFYITPSSTRDFIIQEETRSKFIGSLSLTAEIITDLNKLTPKQTIKTLSKYSRFIDNNVQVMKTKSKKKESK